jgi:hypothetical protein
VNGGISMFFNDLQVMVYDFAYVSLALLSIIFVMACCGLMIWY